mmetsp:Transcript_101977/g.175999  ORF Transcript_101977/g.175999 Transcript_101977/m.175999 type:complete len:208 (-) Transcript_101977:242-865(-)
MNSSLLSQLMYLFRSGMEAMYLAHDSKGQTTDTKGPRSVCTHLGASNSKGSRSFLQAFWNRLRLHKGRVKRRPVAASKGSLQCVKNSDRVRKARLGARRDTNRCTTRSAPIRHPAYASTASCRTVSSQFGKAPSTACFSTCLCLPQEAPHRRSKSTTLGSVTLEAPVSRFKTEVSSRTSAPPGISLCHGGGEGLWIVRHWFGSYCTS